jgi:2'-5' RNA ligase
VELEGLGIFPGILWAGVTRVSGAALGFVARVLEAELEREGFPRDGKAFRPHLTIARARGRRSVRLPPRAQSLSFSEFRWRADEIVLMESLTLPEGARYEVISSALMTER